MRASAADRVHQPLGLDEPGGIDLVPFPLRGDAVANRLGDLGVGGSAAQAAARTSVSSSENRQLRSLPSDVSRIRLQLMQKGRLTEAMKPTRPPPSAYS